MELQKGNAIAKLRGIGPRLMRKDELIKALQRDERNKDCF